MTFAGIWDVWKGPEGSVESVQPSRRMPIAWWEKFTIGCLSVILSPSEFDTWLDREMTDIEKLKGLFLIFRSKSCCYPSSSFVNNPKNDGPRIKHFTRFRRYLYLRSNLMRSYALISTEQRTALQFKLLDHIFQFIYRCL